MDQNHRVRRAVSSADIQPHVKYCFACDEDHFFNRAGLIFQATE